MPNKNKDINHFLDLSDFNIDTLRSILTLAKAAKADELSGTSKTSTILAGKQVALIFEKPSTRTRVSFESAINKMGGNAIIMDSNNTQLGRGEPVSDTANVLSKYVDLIMLRCFQHDTLLEMAENASVPVINGLTDYSHPCQVMADIMTFEEIKGSIEGKKVAWIGDCNNMANSWIQAADKFGFDLVIACPEELAPPESPSDRVTVIRDAKEAAMDADLVTTDTWVSMGDEGADQKRALLKGHQVDDEVMNAAKPDAIFMHCLPAHRGEEVSSSVIDGPKSVIWDEAENRLHIQRAIMLWCMGMLESGKLVSTKPFKGAKVLIVEDNQSEANTARKLLDALGCDVTIAHDGEHAITEAKDNEFNIIFMDTLMPGMNGFETTTKLREEEKGKDHHMAIIAMTADASESEKKHAAQVGINDFIVKPLGPKRITEVMNKWCKLN
jgi:ornithine carbamoyltransferase